MKLELYNNYRDYIKTGDIIAFSGGGGFSDAIKQFTFSPYSHVGMAIWIEPIPNEKRLFIMESTTLNDVPDVNGEYRKGVQMVGMAQRLDGYVGEAWWA